MQRRRAYFLTSVPFSKQHTIDLEINQFDKYYDCIRVDLSTLYNRNYQIQSVADRIIKDFDDFDKFLSEIEDSPLIITNILNSDLPLIYQQLKKKDSLICGFTKEVQSGYYAKRNIKDESLLTKIKHDIRDALIALNLYYRKYDILFANYDYDKGKRKRFVRVHHIKYDLVKHLQPKRLVEGDYIVFCDVGLSTHPMYDGINNRLPLNIYLKKMNDFFDFLERTKKEVVVSVHPKAKYDLDDFKGRRVFCGETPSLIYYSSFVVCHYTTSINEAVLLEKPILIAYSDDFMKYASFETMHSGLEIAKDLKIRPCNIDKLSDTTIIEDYFSTNGYEKFSEKYLVVKNHENQTNIEIINNYLVNNSAN